MPEGAPALSAVQPAPVEPPADRAGPVLSARDDGDREAGAVDREKLTADGEQDQAEAPDDDESGPDGLTGEQRAKLAAARQKKPRGRFGAKKVLAIFIVVAVLLLLAQRMLPLQVLNNVGSVNQQPADVGEVEAKRVPADPAKGGHIVGGEPPAQ